MLLSKYRQMTDVISKVNLEPTYYTGLEWTRDLELLRWFIQKPRLNSSQVFSVAHINIVQDSYSIPLPVVSVQSVCLCTVLKTVSLWQMTISSANLQCSGCTTANKHNGSTRVTPSPNDGAREEKQVERANQTECVGGGGADNSGTR